MNSLYYWLMCLAVVSKVNGQFVQYVSPVQGHLGLTGYNPGNVPFPGLQLTPEINRNPFHSLAAQDTGAENYAPSQLTSQQLPLEHRSPVSPLPLGAAPNQFSGNQIDVPIQGPSSTTFAPTVVTPAATSGSDNDIFSFIQGQLGSNTAKNTFENPFNFISPTPGAGSGSSGGAADKANTQTTGISGPSSGSSAGGSSIASLLSNSFTGSSTPAPKTSSGLSGLLNLLRPQGGSPPSVTSGALGPTSSPQQSRVNVVGGLSLLSRFLELPAELLRLKIYFFTTFLRSLFTAKMNLVRALLDNNIAVLKAVGSAARGAQAGLSGASATLTEALSQNADAISRNSEGLGDGITNTIQLFGNIGADALTNTRTIAGGVYRGTQGLLSGLSGSLDRESRIRELTKEISQNLARRTENVGVQSGQFISDLKRKKIQQIETVLGLVNNGLKGDSNPLGGSGLLNLVPSIDILGLLRGPVSNSSGSALGSLQLPNLAGLGSLLGNNSSSTSDLLSNLSLNDLTDIEGTIRSLGLDSSDLLSLLSRFRRSALEEGIDPHLVLSNEELERIVRKMRESSS